ncbi:MAG: aminotransferase class IV [Luteolibacter sp.]
MTQIWCNGEWLDPLDFSASLMDRGSILGLGLFETMLAVDGVPVFVERHLARLRSGCERLGWHVMLPDLQEIINELLVKNGLCVGRARVRLAMTAGSGPIDDLSLGTSPLLWMVALAINEPPKEIQVNLAPWRRNEHSPIAGLKCASYAENLVALDHARRLGFEETLFLNTAGHLCEAATANLFIVKNGVLLTPSLESGCLPGITRAVVLELANRCRIDSQECMLTPDDLHSAGEIFLTSSIRGLESVSRVGDQVYYDYSVANRLRQYWKVEIERYG